MKSFFKYLLATILGVIIASIFVFFIFMGIIASMVSSKKDEVKVKPNSVLELKFDKEIVDRSANNPFENFDFGGFEPSGKTGLDEILKNIKKAKDDENIKGIFMNSTVIPAGMATVEEIRNALIDFKSSGKFIISYSDYYSQKAYYLSSVADKVYTNPEGGVEFKGLHAELMFFKGTLEKLGIEPIAIRHGKYKSAVEPFICDKMSDANREQTSAYVNSLWLKMVEGISQSRNITVNELNKIADNLSTVNLDEAIKLRLIDSVKYYDQILCDLKTLTGAKKEPEMISLQKYFNAPGARKDKKLAKDKIAIIFAQGEIVTGKGSEEIIGSDRISKAIREARTDSTIKAIVLRVNSPGGSALASEIIWREMKLAAAVKPVVASMGDVAASGGYYISCAADTIVASPNTITGSIGVLGLMMNGQKFMKDKLGVTTDRVTTNKYSDIGNFFRPMTNEEKAIILTEIEKVYDTFITHVAEGRHMTKEKVDEIGQGRVWSGITGKNIGLVDVLGGMDRAVEIAAEMAKLEKYRIVSLPKLEDPFTQLLKSFGEETHAWFMKQELGDNYKYYMQLKQITQSQGIQARIPYLVEIY